MENNKSFTLIETLGVIVIIGILASFILVKFQDSNVAAEISRGKAFSLSLITSLPMNLIAEWKFDGPTATGSPATTDDVKDTCGAYDGTITPGYEPIIYSENNCISGSCLYFDGIDNDTVDIVDIASMANFTLSVWIYNQSGGDTRHSILREYWEIVGTQICYFSYDFDDDYWRCNASNTIPYERWTHIVTTWNGSVISHYINGSLSWKDTVTSGGSSQSLISIAGRSDRKFKGRIDEVKIFNATLPISRINQIYCSGLEKLLASDQITKEEYNQRLTDLNNNLVKYE